MKTQYTFIFDMDGTLYQFDKGQGDIFTSSQFSRDLENNIYNYFVTIKGISADEAISEYDRIKAIYKGEMSLGVEREYGIDRYEYFRNTWNLKPEEYIEKDTELPRTLEKIRGRMALLTAAPRIWAGNVLAYLDIENVFEGNIYSGELDVRKPNPLIFLRIANDLNVPPTNIFSIGDQEYSDIIPAKSIGMKTIRIGSSDDTVADYQADTVKSAICILQKEGFI